MKSKLLALFALLLVMSGCARMNQDDLKTTDSPYDYEKLKQTDVLKVDVPAGQAAVVTLYGDTLYVLDKSEEVMVPYVATQSRAVDSPIVVTYTDIVNVTNALKFSAWGDMSETIAFEDTKSGDYDYNDVVLHIRLARGNATSRGGICVQPVALGSTKKLGLGVYLTEASTNKVWRVILSNDIRTDFFESKTGFLNTNAETGTAFKKWYKFNIYGETFSHNMVKANWFIFDDTDGMFAVTDDFYNKSLDRQGRPYGLVFTNIHSVYYQMPGAGKYGADFFWYPRENKNINTVYPDFDKLFDASSSVAFADVFGSPVMDNCVKVLQLYNNGTYDGCYDNDDTRNLYFTRPTGGYYYFDDVTLPVVSMTEQ